METTSETRQNSVKKLNELIHGISTVMLTTIDQAGEMRSRPMMNLDREFDGVLWFFTRPSPKAQEIQNDQRVNVAFANDSKQHYVSMTGIASIVEDSNVARQLWSPALKAWFPNGPEDRELMLVKVSVTGAEYWDSNTSRMVQLYEMVKAAVTGHHLQGNELGESHKVDLSTK